jgi:hypothetical protein
MIGRDQDFGEDSAAAAAPVQKKDPQAGLCSDGRDWVGHDGSIFGYSDMVFYLPSQQAAVVVASNAADAQAVPSQALWGEIVKILYPDSLPSWP